MSFFKFLSGGGAQSSIRDPGLINALNELGLMDRYYITILLRVMESRYTIAGGAIRLAEENKTSLYIRSLIGGVSQRMNILDKLYTIRDYDYPPR